MRKNNKCSQVVSIMMLLSIIFMSFLSFTQHVDARVMNVKNEGSLTIHKYLNPDVVPVEYCEEWNEDNTICKKQGTGFQGNGTTKDGVNYPVGSTTSKENSGPIPESNDPNKGQGETKPLEGVQFSVYGPLSQAQINELIIEGSDKPQSQDGKYDPNNPVPLDTMKVNDFIKKNTPKYQGTTGEDGIVKFEKIPVNTLDLADNLYLVVETDTPISSTFDPIVQQPSMPVLVNIPSTNPEIDEQGKEVDNYNYNVHLYMKNYAQNEPGIKKNIDKPTHSVGEKVKYRLDIEPLPFNINEFKELVITDELAPQLNFYALGVASDKSAAFPDAKDPFGFNVPENQSLQFYNGTTKVRIPLVQGVDFYVSHPNQNINGTIRWKLTPAGIKKLSGVKEGDGSRLEAYFTAITNEKAKPNEATPNDAKLDFQNKWGYGTKPGPNPNNPNYPPELPPDQPPFTPPPSEPGLPNPKLPTATKPSNVVNTIFGNRHFEKRDKNDSTVKLKGAEFLVRNTPTRPVTALNENREMETFPAGTIIYAIISDNPSLAGYPIENERTVSDGKDAATPWIKENNSYVVGWTKDWKLAYKNHWTVTSDAAGQFNVQGLAYTYPPVYRKMYIFAVMKQVDINGTKVELVSDYQYVLAAPRTSDAQNSEEVESILAEEGHENWRFYKESEADPRRFPELNQPQKDKYDMPGIIDYLSKEAINNYELIEVRAPEGYSPIEPNIDKKIDKDLTFDPATSQDVFEHPFAFTVPAMMTKDGEPTMESDIPVFTPPNYSGDLDDPKNDVVPVPNAKMPKIPLTGGVGTLIFILIGLILIGLAFIIRRMRQKETV